VLGFSELLLTGEMSVSERYNSVEVIKRNGRLLSNIINDILDLSKVEAGKLEIEKVSVPLEEIIHAIGEALQPEAKEKGIDLKVSSDGMIPQNILTDPLRLRQVLLNIVGNAIKFTSHGAVDVQIKLLAETDGPVKLAFVVKDTGEGVRSEQIDRLFTPFMQADISTTRKFGGTGLGLVLSKRLAKALGGDVYLRETAPGKGSTFVITIDPGHSEKIIFDNHIHNVDPKTNVVEFSAEPQRISLNRFKILIADDNLDNQILVKRILRMAGAKVEVANNGREAVEMALHREYSLILMDLQMPEMDGYEATRILRQQGFKKPIIALTAHAMKEEQQRTLSSGFDDHVTKPIDHQTLVKTLASYTA
jgi:CheY-like chemotaxis protein